MFFLRYISVVGLKWNGVQNDRSRLRQVRQRCGARAPPVPPFLEVSKSDVAGCGAVVALPPPRRPARGGVVGGTRAGSSSSTHSVFTARPSFFFPSLTQIFFFFFIVCVSYNFRRISLKGFSNPVPFSLSIRSLVFFSPSLSSVGRSFQITRSACRPSLPLWRRLRNHSGLTLLQENFVEPYQN